MSKKNRVFHTQSGFSSTALVVVLGLVISFGAMSFSILDPAERMQGVRDERRELDIETITQALETARFDNGGKLPQWLHQAGSLELGTCQTCLNIEDELLNYIEYIPQDPKIGNSTQTGYVVTVGEKNTIIVSAPATEVQ